MKGIACAFDARIAKPAEIKTTGAGREFMTLSVIEGEGDNEQWISVSAWADHLKELAPYLVSGVEVYIQGTLRMRHWDNAEGPRSGLQVSASEVVPKALIGARRIKAPPKAKAARGKAVDSQRPIGNGADKPFDDALPF